MKPLVLDSASIFLPVKNRGKYFGHLKNIEKAQQVTVSERTLL